MLRHLKTILQTKFCVCLRGVSHFLPILTLSLRIGITSERSSTLFKDSYLEVLFHTTNSMIWGAITLPKLTSHCSVAPLHNSKTPQHFAFVTKYVAHFVAQSLLFPTVAITKNA